jgi:hypothetical protein
MKGVALPAASLTRDKFCSWMVWHSAVGMHETSAHPGVDDAQRAAGLGVAAVEHAVAAGIVASAAPARALS